MQTVLQASSARPCPEAYAYAGRLMKQGWGVQNAAKAAGVCVADLRDYGVRPVEREAVAVPPRPITVRPKPQAAPVLTRIEPASDLDRVPRIARSRLTVREIVAVIAAEEGLTVEGLVSQRRTRDHTYPRQRLYWLIRALRPEMSLPEIGRRLGGRDHTTILHGVRQVNKRCKDRPEELLRLQYRVSVIEAHGEPGKLEAQIAAVEAQLAELRAIRAASLRIAA